MDTQNMYTFFSVSTGGYIKKMNTVNGSQYTGNDTVVEANDTAWLGFRQIVAGQSKIAPQFSDVKDGKLADRDVVEAALGITSEAANVMYFQAISDKMVTGLFQKLDNKNGITYDSNANILKYDDLLIKVSIVDGKPEAKICMPGNLTELKAKIQKFYAAAGIKQDQSGRFSQDGIYFPAIDVADENLRYYYNTRNTQDDGVVIDMYAYKTVEIALQQFQYVAPKFFRDKSESYSNIGSMSLDIASKTLAFTYEQIAEINKLLRELKEKKGMITLKPNEIVVDAKRLRELEIKEANIQSIMGEELI